MKSYFRNINKAIDLTAEIFPEYYQVDKCRRPYHFAYLFKKNSLISVGVNAYKQDAKILHLARKFNIKKYKKYHYPHAETDAISKSWGKTYLDNRCSMIIIRTNKFGELQDSKPCRDCQTILDSLNINKVWWSSKGNKITNGKMSLHLKNNGELIYG